MGGSSYEPDPAIGEAAEAQVELGQQALDWMMSQADISNAWADDDRAYWEQTFQPLEEQFVNQYWNWGSDARYQDRVAEATAQARNSTAAAKGALNRELRAKGVDPSSGRALAAQNDMALQGALAEAGAANLARRAVEDEAYAKQSDVVNLGRGYAVNPATSLGLSTQTASTGYNAAMTGLNNSSDLLTYQDSQNAAAAQSSNALWGDIGSALGTVAGLAYFSSEEMKERKQAATGALDAVRNMRVEEWQYKPGVADGGARRHVGPYAEEFRENTGVGDGQTIAFQDAIGVTMGAVKDLDAEVRDLSAKIDGLVGNIVQARGMAA